MLPHRLASSSWTCGEKNIIHKIILARAKSEAITVFPDHNKEVS